MVGYGSNKIEFKFGHKDLELAVPPFFIDFSKFEIKSMVRHRAWTGTQENGVYVFIYITKSLKVEKLAALRDIHPDLNFLPTVKYKGIDEVEEFKKSITELEREWKYSGNGIWTKVIENVTIYMVLIVDGSRWTIRPLISKEGVSGFYAEIPVEITKMEEFLDSIEEEELEEIHYHGITIHSHLTVKSIDRFVELVKKWDYYFSEGSIWPPLLEFRMIR